MKTYNIQHVFKLIIPVMLVLFSCSKKNEPSPQPPTPPAQPDTTTLKQAASYPVGVAISYDLMKNAPGYAALVKQQFDRVTFEYQMKHGANVRNDGSYDFSRTDELVNLIQAAGMNIYGHTLVWHQNNNGVYLRSLTGGPVGSNLIINPGFENDFANWANLVSSTAPTSGSISIITSGAQSGTKAAKILVNTPVPDPWSIQ